MRWKRKLGKIDTWGDSLIINMEVYRRCWFESYYGITVIPWKRDKVTRMRNIIRQMGIYIIGGAEVGKNWSMLRAEKFLDKLLRSEGESRIVCGSNSNTNNIIMSHQNGGTCVGEFNIVDTYSSSHGVEPYGLGRWLYIVLKGKDDLQNTYCDRLNTTKITER